MVLLFSYFHEVIDSRWLILVVCMLGVPCAVWLSSIDKLPAQPHYLPQLMRPKTGLPKPKTEIWRAYPSGRLPSLASFNLNVVSEYKPFVRVVNC
jgi:hypothetical protein